jgi:ABC-2 type transport system permease protein
MNTADTNFSTPESAMAETPPTSSVAARKGTIWKTLFALVRREFWEHRALWLAPTVVAVLLVACAFPAHIDFGELNGTSSPLDSDRGRIALFGLIQWGLTVPLYLVMVIILSFYLLDCLYAERKDRSILFWKSMPVSDGATVTSKLLVALVVVPLGVYLLAIVTSLLFSVIWIARTSLGQVPGIGTVWDLATWLKVQALMLTGVILSMAWYAPLAAYLLLVSAWARRSVFLWSSLPPVVAILIERLALGTHYVGNFLQYRMDGIWLTTNMQQAVERAVVSTGHDHIVSLGSLFDTLNITPLFLNVDLWLGLAVAGGFAFAAARIRRYRDDT